MLNYELLVFNARKDPTTQALLDEKLANQSPYQEFIHSKLSKEKPFNNAKRIVTSELTDMCSNWCADNQYQLSKPTIRSSKRDLQVNYTLAFIQPLWSVPFIIELNKKFSSVSIYQFHNEDKFSMAKIEEVSDDWLKLLTFGPKRSLSKMFKLIKLDAVSRVDVNSPYQNNIVKLHDSDL